MRVDRLDRLVLTEEMLPRQGIDGVVERAALLVLVEHRLRAEQGGVPLRAAIQR
jgi:hypothetical protein